MLRTGRDRRRAKPDGWNNFTPSVRGKRTLRLVTVLVGASVLPATLAGCYVRDDPGIEVVAAGAEAEVGPIEIAGMVLVSRDEGKPGRLLGTLFNNSDADVEVTLADEDDEVTVTVEASGDLGFDTNPHTFETVAQIPGSLVPVTVTAGEESTEVQVPVMNGSLERYRPYLPEE